MASKKRGKRIARKKVPVKNKKDLHPINRVRATGRKIRLVVRNLVVFILLSIISYILYLVSEKDTYINFFGFAYVILGVVALALFIVLLILVLLKAMKR